MVLQQNPKSTQTYTNKKQSNGYGHVQVEIENEELEIDSNRKILEVVVVFFAIASIYQKSHPWYSFASLLKYTLAYVYKYLRMPEIVMELEKTISTIDRRTARYSSCYDHIIRDNN